MNSQLQVKEDILVFAFRYSLGRSSYAPSSVMDAIMLNIEKLADHTLLSLMKEIDEYHSLGSVLDEREWRQFQRQLQDILLQRQIMQKER